MNATVPTAQGISALRYLAISASQPLAAYRSLVSTAKSVWGALEMLPLLPLLQQLQASMRTEIGID